MQTVSIQQASSHFSQIIEQVINGEDVVISKGNEPIVKMTLIPKDKKFKRFGGLKNMPIIMGDSFNLPLEDFKIYEPK